MVQINLTVDGAKVSDDVEPRMLLVFYLREKLGKTGTVIGCDTSNCGACTVHLNGRSVKSCNVLAVQADGAEVTTIEGLAQDGKLHARTPEIPWGELPGYPLAPPETFADPSIYAVEPQGPVMRYESAVINRAAEASEELQPGQVHAALVARDGSWVTHGVIEGLMDVDGFATTATTSLELLVLGREPSAMARAAARVAEMGGGFAFDRGWSAPLEIDGLIVAGGFGRALLVEKELTRHMAANGYPFHDPLYSLLFASGDFLPEVRLTPRGVLEVKTRTVLEAPSRIDTVPAP